MQVLMLSFPIEHPDHDIYDSPRWPHLRRLSIEADYGACGQRVQGRVRTVDLLELSSTLRVPHITPGPNEDIDPWHIHVFHVDRGSFDGALDILRATHPTALRISFRLVAGADMQDALRLVASRATQLRALDLTLQLTPGPAEWEDIVVGLIKHSV